MGIFATTTTCPKCGGSGKIIHQPCPKCHGNGTERRQRTIKASIPAGIDNGQTISLRGQGNAGRNGGPAGDLIVGMAAAGDLKEENVTAFYIPCGLGISLKPSVWHAVPMAVGKDVMSVCIFKNNTSHDDIYFASLEEEIGLML